MNLDYPNPFIIKIEVKESDIDELGHANNKAYLDWSMEAAWRHSESLGLKPEDYIAMDCAMVARRHELNYLVPTFEGDQLTICTWIINNDGKYRSRREYQILRGKDNKTVFRGATDWVCIRLKDGKLYPMPKEFIDAYQPTNM